MDLSIIINDTKVKFRVAGLVQTPRGYLFEKSEKGYIFAIGGKIMLNEDSKEAIKREIKEEIGLDAEKLNLCAVIENFYKSTTEKVHEICFVYEIDNLYIKDLPKELVEIPIADIEKHDIRPTPIVGILKSGNKSGNRAFRHIVVKNNL